MAQRAAAVRPRRPAAAWVLACVLALLLVPAGSAGAATTTITFGFDDGMASQYEHRAILDAHGVASTFFVNSGKVGRPGYMTWAQLADLQAAGHEIGGHTIDHVSLTSVSATERRRQVCDDLATLRAHGLTVRNFAYPHGHWSSAAKATVADCGYATARTTGGLDFPSGPIFAETLPPRDPYTLRAIQTRLSVSLGDFQQLVNAARNSGGGWLNVVLHGICDTSCSSTYDTRAATLDAMLAWATSLPDVRFATTAQALGQAEEPPPPPPPDTTAPTVALTAPEDGTTVSDTVTLSADASDDTGVVRVDFLVDGVIVGDDTSAPYTHAWDSAAAGATATLAARAVDAAGNVGTSAARTVTVAHAPPPPPPPPPSGPITYVTFGFDDGMSSQWDHRGILDQHGVASTFFVNSNKVGRPGYMTWAQLQQLQAEGHEIGGHTLDHVALTRVTATEQRRQVCDDRAALVAHGLTVRNFAYPHGLWSSTAKSVVAGCGYATARTTGGLDFPSGPIFAETLPPRDPYVLRAIQTNSSVTLSDFQQLVNAARNSGGGWLNVVLHGVCTSSCSGYATSTATLDAMLAWATSLPDVRFATTAQALRQG